jgi:ABC-type multidrug transport system fused ATPase/permease subunit
MTITNIIKQTFLLLERRHRKAGLWIIILMVFNALLDFFSVAAFFPILMNIIRPEFMSGNSRIAQLYTLFGFNSQSNFIITITIAVLCFILVKNILSWLISHSKVTFALHVREDMSSRALTKCMEKNYLDFTKTDFTKEVHTITSHPLSFSNNILLSLLTIISESLVALFILTCIVSYDYRVFFLVALILIPMFLVFQLRRKGMKKISNELKTTYPLILKYAGQVVEGFVEIKTYGKTPFFFERFQVASKRLTESFKMDQMMQAGTLRLTEILIALVMCSLVVYSLITHLDQQQTLFLIGIYAVASFRIVPSSNRILHCLQQIRTNEHVISELSHLKAEADTPRFSEVKVGSFNESIEFRNISFAYPDSTPTLLNFSLRIKRGERIAITGPSGEGKTTMLLIAVGLISPTQGEILVDGKSITDQRVWLTRQGYISQNPYIIDGTISENIAFGVPYAEANRDLIHRLIAELQLQDLMDQLPNGIDANIGERGSKISGGQRQRIALARALYRDADILIFDEATNQVNDALESEIMSLLKNDTYKNKTVIMVTHKIPDTAFFDNVYILEKGKIHQTIFQS